MKDSIKETLVNLFISGPLYFALTFLITLPFADRGDVRISETYKDSNNYYVNIEVTNYTDGYINGIYAKLPIHCNIQNLSSVSSLVVSTEKSDFDDIKLIKFDMIEPKSSTVLLIALDKNTDRIYFTNLKEKRFSLTYRGAIINPAVKIVKQILPTIIMYAIIFTFFQFINSYQFEKRQKEQLKKIDEKEEKIQEIEKDLAQTKEKLEKTSKYVYKRLSFQKLQLSHYSKELDFWRNTIRQLLYSGDRKNKKAESLFEMVTKSLETFTVKSKRNLDVEEVVSVADAIEKLYEKEKETI